MKVKTWAIALAIGLQVGLNVPMSDKSMIGSDMMLGVSYGQFHYNGLGFRAGFQYAASTANINDVFGVPVAFAYRTKSKSAQERFETGAIGARDAMVYRHPYGSGNARGFLGGFLVNLFSDMEFFAGMTPGYIAGASERPGRTSWGTAMPYWEDTWVEKNTSPAPRNGREGLPGVLQCRIGKIPGWRRKTPSH